MSPHVISPGDFEYLVCTCENVLRAYRNPVVDGFLNDWPERHSAIKIDQFPQHLPVLQWIDSFEGDGQNAELVSLLQKRAAGLNWRQSYTVEDFGAGFLAAYGWTEMIGMRVPIQNPNLACGFLVLGPQVEYPDHSHDAEEIYVVLAGEGEFTKGQEGWVSKKSGDIIHHTSGLPHSVRTGKHAVLILYLWRGGDLRQKSKIL